jgi:hypothetical protein
MSLKHIQRVFDQSQTRGGTRMALVVVADKADDLGYCWPGQELIAKQAGLTTRSIGRNLQEAADLGELIILARTGAKNRYVVSLGAEEKEIFQALTERAYMSRAEATAILEAWKAIKSDDILSGVDKKSDDILSGVETANPRQNVVSPPTSCPMTPDKMSSDPSRTINNPNDDDDQPAPPAVLEEQTPAPVTIVLDAPVPDWVARLHESVFMVCGPMDADVIKQFPAKYPRAWIVEAYRRIKAQMETGKRITTPGAYLAAILDGMNATGLQGDDPQAGQTQSRGNWTRKPSSPAPDISYLHNYVADELAALRARSEQYENVEINF